MCGLIEANLDLCKVPENETEVVQAEASDFLSRSIAAAGKPWDMVFFDPPYANDYLKVLNAIGSHATKLLTDSAILIVEHHHKKELPDDAGRLHRTRVLKQGDSALSFYELTTE